MISYSYIPQPPLSDFVALFWYQARYAPPHPKERCLPDGSVELIINLHEDRLPVFDAQNHAKFETYPGMLIYGAHSQYFVIDTTYQTAILGIHFKPGGAFPFLGLPASELHNSVVPLDVFWGTSIAELRCRLLEAVTPQLQFKILEQFLLRQVRQPLERHRAVKFALNQFRHVPQTQSISDVTDQIGLSSRRFIEVFREEVGLTPKLFCRLRRFQEALRQIEREEQVNWVDIALTCGYFDQAHFIHDFQAFSGINPMTYVMDKGERFGHAPIWD